MLYPNDVPLVIGIAGRAGSGKDTCGNLLISSGARGFATGDHQKRLAKAVFGFSDAQLWGTQAEKEAIDPRWGISARVALDRLVAVREIHGEDVLINTTFRKIRADFWGREDSGRLYVVTDVRFPNEARAIARSNDHEGYVIRLRCPNANTTVDPNSKTERSVDEIDPSDVYAEIEAPRSEGAKLLLDKFAAVVAPLLGERSSAANAASIARRFDLGRMGRA